MDHTSQPHAPSLSVGVSLVAQFVPKFLESCPHIALQLPDILGGLAQPLLRPPGILGGLAQPLHLQPFLFRLSPLVLRHAARLLRPLALGFA